jgi:hypothetical protein
MRSAWWGGVRRHFFYRPPTKAHIADAIFADPPHRQAGEVLLFMQSKAAGGFAGQMEELKFKLDAYRHSVPEDRNWPKDSTRLSTRLDRITKALATAGIECRRPVDRRSEGGTQRDVVLSWRKPEEASGNVTILRRRFI